MKQLRFFGIADAIARFLEKEQLSDSALWARFVEEFRVQIDGTNQGWRGEFWGKMLRGGALVYAYTKNEDLYRVLTETVRDMMTTAEADGRVSTYTKETEFDSWDLWSRKYVMLASEYYLEICRDEAFKKEIIAFLCRCADYIVAHIGDGEGQKRITAASRSWFGVNSSSILEPFVRLYRLTGEKRYLDFSAYIVNTGGAEGINIFELAYENRLLPYQYGVSKAYEMTSCFEGLLEYYYVTGIEKYKTAVLNYAYAVLNSECSVIGSAGVTHELFDHTRTRQTVPYDGVMQETCVTVTWMKFCARVLALTKDPLFADTMEISFYNAYAGALNTEHRECPYAYEKFVLKQGNPSVKSTFLPFDSYSPLTPGIRGAKIGGSQMLHDTSYYGCCACIGAAGVGVFLERAVVAEDGGITVNFFEPGEARLTLGETEVTLTITADYPRNGDIRIAVHTSAPARFPLRIRIPAWTDSKEGYRVYTEQWSDNEILLSFPMEVKFHFPESWEEDLIYTDTSQSTAVSHCAGPVKVYHDEKDDHYVALTRGPLTLAADGRLGKAATESYSFASEGELCDDVSIAKDADAVVKLRFLGKDGKEFYLVDYASAGRDWKTPIAAWLPTE